MSDDLKTAKRHLRRLIGIFDDDTLNFMDCIYQWEADDNGEWSKHIVAAKRFLGIPTPDEDEEDRERAAEAAERERINAAMTAEYGPPS